LNPNFMPFSKRSRSHIWANLALMNHLTVPFPPCRNLEATCVLFSCSFSINQPRKNGSQKVPISKINAGRHSVSLEKEVMSINNWSLIKCESEISWKVFCSIGPTNANPFVLIISESSCQPWIKILALQFQT
jgi:hypothetical protein